MTDGEAGKLSSAERADEELAASARELLAAVEAGRAGAATWLKTGALLERAREHERAVEVFSFIARSLALEGRLPLAAGAVKAIQQIDPDHRATAEAVAKLYALRDRPGRSETIRRYLSDTSEVGRRAMERWGGLATGGAFSPLERLFARFLEWQERLVDEALAQDSEAGAAAIDARLPRIPLLSALEPKEIEDLLARAEKVAYGAGEVVARQGERGDAFWIVTRGSVAISRTTESGEVTLATLTEGDFFGELAFFSEAPRSATVTAVDDVEAILLSRRSLGLLIGQHPAIGKALLEHGRQRLVGLILETSPLFRPLSPADRTRVVRDFELVEVAAGNNVIRKGEAPDAFFVILSGEVVVSDQRADGRVVELKVLGEGEFFGEIGFITGAAATATCTAVRPSKLFRYPRARFMELVATDPRLLEVLSDSARARVGQSQALGLIVGSEEIARAGLL